MNTRVFFSEMLFKTLVAFMWCSTTRGGGCGCTWQRKKQWKHSEHVIVKRVIKLYQMTCPWSRHSSWWKSCHISKLLLTIRPIVTCQLPIECLHLVNILELQQLATAELILMFKLGFTFKTSSNHVISSKLTQQSDEHLRTFGCKSLCLSNNCKPAVSHFYYASSSSVLSCYK